MVDLYLAEPRAHDALGEARRLAATVLRRDRKRATDKAILSTGDAVGGREEISM